jgi:hypothetical protein
MTTSSSHKTKDITSVTESTPITVEQGMKMILETEPNKTVEDAALEVGCAPIRLLEMFRNKLGATEVMAWDMIPSEHANLLSEFKRQIEAETSVRRLESEATTQLPQSSESVIEPPILEEEPQPTRRRGRPKKESTALTKTKSTKLKESDKNSQQLAASDQEVKVALHARKGQKSGAQLATIELAAEDATYRQIKGQALVRKVGQLTSEIAGESDFNPIQVLKDLGINPNSEIFEDLREQIEPALGKLESATAEIVENAWVNGVDLGVELTALDNLMNSNNSTESSWY